MPHNELSFRSEAREKVLRGMLCGEAERTGDAVGDGTT